MRVLNNIDKAIIYSNFNCYKKQYNLPEMKLDDIILVDDSSMWAEFLTKELYEKKYNLYINEKLPFKSDNFVENVLFHEFTHLADSIKFSDAPYSVFMYIMYTYSECHASEIKLDHQISKLNETPSIYSVLYNGNTLKDFMNHECQTFQSDIIKAINSNQSIRIRSLYYFCGYIRTLQKYNINYFYNICFQNKQLEISCYRVIKIMTEESSIPDIIKSYIELRDLILKLRRK